MTLFGESKTEDEDTFFTGKPEVDGLGYAFLFRNYRSNLGKWQTADPLGYPDGWNNKAYCNNRVVRCIDWLGGVTIDGFWSAWGNYTSGGGDAIIAPSVITPAAGTDEFTAIMNDIETALAGVDKNSNRGTLSGSDSFSWFQGLTLGRTGVTVSWSFTWNATEWYHLADDEYVRSVYATDVAIQLTVSDAWDFTTKASDPWYMNLLEEMIPNFIADYGGLLPGTPYSLSGDACIDHSFSVWQSKRLTE